MELDKEKLSPLKENILNWYPFKKNKSLLEISSNDYIFVDMLRKKDLKVEIIKSYEYKNFEEKFDYILINYAEEKNEELEKLMEYATNNIKKDGIILLIANNKYGLQTFNYNSKKNDFNLVSKYKINLCANKLNIKNIKFYYPLPNYKYTNVIFTDNHLPSRESILRDLTIYDENEILILNERKKYIEIIKDDPSLFSFFANTYLVEFSNSMDNTIEFISFNNSRKAEYRMITILYNDVARKFPINELERKHLDQIKLNIQKLNKLNINLLDTIKENYIESKLVKEVKSFDKILIEYAKNNDYNKLVDYIKLFYNELKKKLEASHNIENTVFNKYKVDISKEIKDKLYFVKDGFYDLIFQNSFYFENNFYFYDQEWIEENVPLEFIMFRAINYLANSSNIVDRNIIYKKLYLVEYIKLFERLEEQIQNKIVDKVTWQIHSLNNKTIENIQDTLQHYKNLDQMAQIEKQNLQNEIQNLKKELNNIINSKSWKITKPLRKIKDIIKK